MSKIDFNTSLNLSTLRHTPVLTKEMQAQRAKGGIYVKQIDPTESQKDTIQKAKEEMAGVKFPIKDVIYLKMFGINLPFKNGAQASEFLKSKNAQISYAHFSNENVHACLDTTKDVPVILINQKYKDLASKADILAISEAMLHEAGHAKDNDSLNSIQEELDCLALNALAHRYHKKNHPNVFENQNSPLYTEGVNLYSDLFFDSGMKKTALKQRVADKYGYLDTYSPNHKASKLAGEIKELADKA